MIDWAATVVDLISIVVDSTMDLPILVDPKMYMEAMVGREESIDFHFSKDFDSNYVYNHIVHN